MAFEADLGAAFTDQWHRAPSRWGHPWHAMCSYMAMFPPTIPRVFIDWLTQPGDVVYDPFSGRGTTILEACTSGRIGLGSDANPLAWVLSAAKAAPPSSAGIGKRLHDLRGRLQIVDGSDEAPIIREIFDPYVLGQLLWLRRELSVRRAVDRHFMAVLLGILHMNARRDGTARGLSIPMPNTFAMAPRYVSRYMATHGLRPPKVNVLDMLEARAKALGAASTRRSSGFAWVQDATKAIRYPTRYSRPKLIFASPPYLGVMRYAKMNWLRMWLLGHEPKTIDDCLFGSGSLSKYKHFMTSTLGNLEQVLGRGGRICLVIGDVRHGDRQINLAGEVADACVRSAGLKVDAIIDDRLPVRQKVSRIWGDSKGRATEVDRILLLSRRGTGELPPLPTIQWA